MVKSELIDLIASRAYISTQQAEDVVNLFFDSIIQELASGEGRVEIRGFGAFTVRSYKAYEGRNPKTGKKIGVAEKKLPFWKAGLELRQRVDGLGGG